jgi:hypothetical protein
MLACANHSRSLDQHAANARRSPTSTPRDHVARAEGEAEALDLDLAARVQHPLGSGLTSPAKAGRLRGRETVAQLTASVAPTQQRDARKRTVETTPARARSDRKKGSMTSVYPGCFVAIARGGPTARRSVCGALPRSSTTQAPNWTLVGLEDLGSCGAAARSPRGQHEAIL